MAAQTVKVIHGSSRTEANLTRAEHKKIVRAAIKDLRESPIQKKQTSWFDEMKTLRRATTTATYGELHTRGDWGQTE